ncbi:MAG: type II toxin-antitoxin system PemK/MazF family toxin [Acidimicrobiia bacterium]
MTAPSTPKRSSSAGQRSAVSSRTTSSKATSNSSRIFALRLPKGVGHEQAGPRLGVVVQSDAFLPRSVVLVAPTSRSAKPASFRPLIDINGETARVLVEYVRAVDLTGLGDLAGHVTPEEGWGIDTALLTVLGLS